LLSLECVSPGIWRLRVVRDGKSLGQVSTVEGNLASVRAIAAAALRALAGPSSSVHSLTPTLPFSYSLGEFEGEDTDTSTRRV
jgi:hypothetical protein